MRIPPSSVNSSELILTKNYGIKNLTIFNYGVSVDSLPIFPPRSLESLTWRGPCLIPHSRFNDAFSHLYELELIDVDAVSDVRMFVKIKKLSLFACHNITDITPLQTTRTITIAHCERIMDYRNALTYSHRINIYSWNPNAVIDVSCFRAVKSLSLEAPGMDPLGLSFASDSSPIGISSTLIRLRIEGNIQYQIAYFDHLQELTITASKILTKVNALGCIPILGLFNLPNVESLHGLGYDDDGRKGQRNRVVSIFGLEKVKDFTPLNTIPIVAIRRCEGFVDLGQVKDVKNLSVWNCDNIFPPVVPMEAEQVTLGGEIKFNLLSHFPNGKELDLSNVTGVKGRSLEGLETLTKLGRVVVTSSWEEQKTKGWEILREDYSKYVSSHSSIIYVKNAIP